MVNRADHSGGSGPAPVWPGLTTDESMKKRKILIADDVELFRALEKSFFRREEFDLIEAKTGRQAVELAVADMNADINGALGV